MSMLRPGAGLLAVLSLCAAPQSTFDREASTREYVRFLVLQLDQWSIEFPRQFYMAAVKPPVDSSRLSEAGRAAAGEFGDAIKRLAKLADAKDVLTNVEFRRQLDRTLAPAGEVNQVMATQRFPAILQSDWEQIRSLLNNLARVYKVETLAALEAPGAGAEHGGRGKTLGAAAAPGAGLSGYIVDLSCAKRGKGMWANAECVARCVRDGDKVVLVTEDGKIYQISNQEKIAPESYGQVVTLTGKVQGDTITVESLKM